MSLNIELLEGGRLVGQKFIARCPACAEEGRDRHCEHLVVMDRGDGPFRCIVDSEGAGGAHNKRIFELVGIKGAKHDWSPKRVCRLLHSDAKRIPTLPVLKPMNIDHIDMFGQARNLQSYAGIGEGIRRGFLHYCETPDSGRMVPTLLITDSSRRNVEMRRLDGSLWQDIGKKVKTLKNVQGDWPIGVADIGDRPLVGLCEGGPDFCALMLFGWAECISPKVLAPVFMTGASKTIPSDALSTFRRKRVRIFVHQDRDGFAASERWAAQLWRAGATYVDGFSFQGLVMPDGRPVKDLADYATTVTSFDFQTTHVLRGL
jgi:hypothetical protein